MCGIADILCLDASPVGASRVEPMIEPLRPLAGSDSPCSAASPL